MRNVTFPLHLHMEPEIPHEPLSQVHIGQKTYCHRSSKHNSGQLDRSKTSVGFLTVRGMTERYDREAQDQSSFKKKQKKWAGGEHR